MISKIAFAMAITIIGQSVNAIKLDTNDLKNTASFIANKITNTTLGDIGTAAWNSKGYSAAAGLGAFIVLAQINAQYNPKNLYKALLSTRPLSSQEIVDAVKANTTLYANVAVKTIIDNTDTADQKVTALKALDGNPAIAITDKTKFTHLSPKTWEWKQAADARDWLIFSSIKNSSKSLWNAIKTIFGSESYAQQVTNLEGKNTVLNNTNVTLNEKITTQTKDINAQLKLAEKSNAELVKIATVLGLDATTLIKLTAVNNDDKALDKPIETAAKELITKIEAKVNGNAELVIKALTVLN